MLVKIDTKRVFIPKWRNNREQPKDEQITAEYKIPTVKMKARLLPKPGVVYRYDAKGNVKDGEVAFQTETRSLVEAMLTKLTNLAYEDGGEVKQISNAADLLAAPSHFETLADELGAFFKEEVEKGLDEKN